MTEDVFRWVIAAAVVLACLAFIVQAGVAIALYRIAKRSQDKAVSLAEEAAPLLASTRQILDTIQENGPRLTAISAEALEIARSAHQQILQIGQLVEDATARAQARLEQIDRTVQETVIQVGQVGGNVKSAVLKPVREANAVLAGVKAAVVTYAQGKRRPSIDHITQDEEMFI